MTAEPKEQKNLKERKEESIRNKIKRNGATKKTNKRKKSTYPDRRTEKAEESKKEKNKIKQNGKNIYIYI